MTPDKKYITFTLMKPSFNKNTAEELDNSRIDEGYNKYILNYVIKSSFSKGNYIDWSFNSAASNTYEKIFINVRIFF